MSTSNRSSYNNPDFTPFQSGNSLCYPSKDYAKFKGGSSLISTKNGKNLYVSQNFKLPKSELQKNISGKSYSTSAGGSKNKKITQKKGGYIYKSHPHPLNDNNIDDIHYHSPHGPHGPSATKVANTTPSEKNNVYNHKKNLVYGGNKNIQKKQSKNKKGGFTQQEEMIPLPKGIMSEGNPADSIPENIAQEQSGGKKNKNKNKKGGFSGEESGVRDLSSQLSNIQKTVQNGLNKLHKNSVFSDMVGQEQNAKVQSEQSGGKKNTKKNTKNMKGGKETSGATGLPSDFYSGKISEGYPANSGKGVRTNYGIIDPKDAGVGTLAPYNTSLNASKLSMFKTGGNKKSIIKNKKGGLIPKMSDLPFKTVDDVVNTGTKQVKSFFKRLEQNYDKSIEKIQSTKNGLSRLSNGGFKKNISTKITKNLKGGDGSAFSSTLNSRGPSNYPDMSEKMFRQFSKSGTYIPNSKLSQAAAPKLTGGPKVTKVTGFDGSFESTFASATGGKKQNKKSKK